MHQLQNLWDSAVRYMQPTRLITVQGNVQVLSYDVAR
jgi:hypothetical protein